MVRSLATPGQWTIPLVISASNLRQQGFVRIINHSDHAGTVSIEAIDDSGQRFGPVSLSLEAKEAVQFNSRDLEQGNSGIGLSAGVGDGAGDWRLELSTTLDIEPLAYIRTPGDVLTSVHEVASEETPMHYRVPFFNPASSRSLVSRLRLINPGDSDADVTLTGLDARGNAPPQGEVSLDLPAGAARTLTAQQIEEGASGLTGRFGDGEGEWQLFVSSSAPIRVMGLMQTRSGHLSNLSRGVAPGQRTIPLVISASNLRQQGFVRIINRSDHAGTVSIEAIDDSGQRFGPVSLSLEAKEGVRFNSVDLEQGNSDIGLSAGVGDGAGDWRLELSTTLDIEPLAFIRMPGGVLTSMHEVASEETPMHYRVPFFNPASNRSLVSRLRLINPGERDADVTITGLDARGDAPPRGEVSLDLPAGAARTLTAQQIEEGASGLTGRFGDGEGKWQLFVSSSAPIRVMGLMQTRSGHLSNLSTTTRGAEGSKTVRPLQTISLSVPGGLGESDYTVLMDLSGTGAFPADDTIEVEGITTDDDRILFASPLTQALPATNASHGFAVRAKRAADGAVSNILRYSIEDIVVPAHLAGYPTAVLEVLLKSLFISSDDPFLELSAPSMTPGLGVAAARTLDLDTTLSDVYAEAILQSVFGFSYVDWAAETGPLSTGAFHDMLPSEPGFPLAAGTVPVASHSTKQWCDLVPTACDAANKMVYCVARAIAEPGVTGRVRVRNTGRCVKMFPRNTIEGLGANTATVLTVASFTRLIVTDKRVFGRLLGKKIPYLRQINTINTFVGYTVNVVKYAVRVHRATGSESCDSNRHLVQDGSGSYQLTRCGVETGYENVRAVRQETTQDSPARIGEAERDSAGRDLNDEEREAAGNILDVADRQQREAEAIDELEGVYLNEDDPVDVFGNRTDGDIRVAESCAAGYEEFPIDDETSTCVFQSLVEENCYAGSRPVNVPGVDTCLYYSLDFFQPGDTCRTNYARVSFQGRQTCRWAELGAHEPAWYTLYKGEEDDGGGEPPDDDGQEEGTHFGLDCVDFDFSYTPPQQQACGSATVAATNNCGRHVLVSTHWWVTPSNVRDILGIEVEEAYWIGSTLNFGGGVLLSEETHSGSPILPTCWLSQTPPMTRTCAAELNDVETCEP